MVVTSSLHALGYGNMLRESWTGEEWFLRKVLSKQAPKVIFDVGANVGNYSRKILEYFDAEVHAFEPNSNSFAHLKTLPNCVIKNQSAVSDTDGTATLHFRSEMDVKASLDVSVTQGHQMEVRSVRLETYCRDRRIKQVDFLKIDTEGFEREVLLGMGDLRPKYIQFEFNIDHLKRGYTVFDISKILQGYTFYRLLPNGWVKINPKSYIDNIFIFSNFVAVRND